MGKYSKLIGALVGNVVAIALVYLASYTSLAKCGVLDGAEVCTMLGMDQAEITAVVMLALNSAFVYFFPPNKDTVRSFAMFGVVVLSAVALSACSLSMEQQTAVAKAYDRTCTNVPAIYQSFVLVATAKQASDRTMKKAASIKASADYICANRPTDLASAAVTLAALYAQLVTISAQVEKS
jgi:hypothetical protein